MNEKEIRKLVKIVEESNISELEVSRWGKKVRIIKTQSNSNHTLTTVTAPIPKEVITTVPTVEVSVPTPSAVVEKPTAPTIAPKKEIIEIHSPMVGTFYRAPAPGAEPYVKVDDHISKGKVLCIVEAMKLMNEIEAEVSGTIVEILVENAQPVEYNQPLFKVAIE